jgi:hypothetical protein
MENKQIKLLATLAKEIRAEKKDKVKIMETLQSAKILTRSGNLSGPYRNLNRVTTDKK